MKKKGITSISTDPVIYSGQIGDEELTQLLVEKKSPQSYGCRHIFQNKEQF